MAPRTHNKADPDAAPSDGDYVRTLLIGGLNGLPHERILREARRQHVNIECHCVDVAWLPTGPTTVQLVVHLVTSPGPNARNEAVVERARTAGISIATVSPATFSIDISRELARIGVTSASPHGNIVGCPKGDAWWTWTGAWWVASGRTKSPTGEDLLWGGSDSER